MVDIEEINVGDKVKIVSSWNPDCHENNYGCMDEYLGMVVTVTKVIRRPTTPFPPAIPFPPHIKIEEDKGCWSWVGAAIECIVVDDDDTLVGEDKDVFINFLKGG